MKSILSSILFFISFFACSTIDASETGNAQTSKLPISLNLQGTEIFGLNEQEFIAYYSGAFNKSEAYAELIFKRFIKKFETTFNENLEGEIPSIYTGVLSLNKITENGGYVGSLLIYNDKDSLLVNVPINVKDGKWNDFESLLYENAIIGASHASTTIKEALKDILIYDVEFTTYGRNINSGDRLNETTFIKNGITKKEIDSIIKQYKDKFMDRNRKNPNIEFLIKYKILK